MNSRRIPLFIRSKARYPVIYAATSSLLSSISTRTCRRISRKTIRMYEMFEKLQASGDFARPHEVPSEARPYKCMGCSKRFHNPDSMKMHMKVHHCEKLYRCTECENPVQLADQSQETLVLSNRKKQQSSDETPTDKAPSKTYSCKTCAKSFPTQKELRQHVVEHNDETPFNCAKCAAQFKTPRNLQDHLVIVHADQVPLSAPCATRLSNRRSCWRSTWILTPTKLQWDPPWRWRTVTQHRRQARVQTLIPLRIRRWSSIKYICVTPAERYFRCRRTCCSTCRVTTTRNLSSASCARSSSNVRRVWNNTWLVIWPTERWSVSDVIRTSSRRKNWSCILRRATIWRMGKERIRIWRSEMTRSRSSCWKVKICVTFVERVLQCPTICINTWSDIVIRGRTSVRSAERNSNVCRSWRSTWHCIRKRNCTSVRFATGSSTLHPFCGSIWWSTPARSHINVLCVRNSSNSRTASRSISVRASTSRRRSARIVFKKRTRRSWSRWCPGRNPSGSATSMIRRDRSAAPSAPNDSRSWRASRSTVACTARIVRTSAWSAGRPSSIRRRCGSTRPSTARTGRTSAAAAPSSSRTAPVWRNTSTRIVTSARRAASSTCTWRVWRFICRPALEFWIHRWKKQLQFPHSHPSHPFLPSLPFLPFLIFHPSRHSLRSRRCRIDQ